MNKFSKLAAQVLMLIMDKLTPSCDIITHKISKSMDHNISMRERLQIKLHILGCKLCKRYQKQLTTLNDAFENYAQDETTDQKDTLSDEARQKIKKILSNQSEN